MTIGVGGKTTEEAIDGLVDMTGDVQPIQTSEFKHRLQRLQQETRSRGGDAVYLHAGTNLYYFTGLRWHPSERMVAAIVPAEGEICYIAPRFELDTLRDYWLLEADILAWEEHESPYELVHEALTKYGLAGGTLLIDEVTPFFIFDGLRDANHNWTFRHAQPVTQSIRSRKSASEIALLQVAHNMTLEVQKAAASILRSGISTEEVTQFIHVAHQKVGAPGGSFFCIVLFGVDTSFPHGVKHPQRLQANDWVLIDTGCLLHGYNSDITRSYSCSNATDEQRIAWNAEKAAQLSGFDAAKLGMPCEECDQAARTSLERAGYGPDYRLPGLPHRTGHGCGLDIHEGPNLVRGEKTLLDVGMVFSCEPMLVLPGKLGVRLEDHFFMSEQGPVWFTPPSKSVDDPFGLGR